MSIAVMGSWGAIKGVSRVESCDCGLETSCYGCLRTPRNERHHEDLSRGAALTVLTSLRGLARRAEPPDGCPRALEEPR